LCWYFESGKRRFSLETIGKLFLPGILILNFMSLTVNFSVFDIFLSFNDTLKTV